MVKDTTAQPLISIVTPVFNAERYLEQCLDSVLQQSYPHIEHVFADGRSSDRTLEILESYKVRYPGRIRYISEPDNGVGSALKKAYAICRGDIVGWIDADDLYEPGAVDTVVNFFGKNPDAAFVYGRCRIIDGSSQPIGSFITRDFDKLEWLNNWHYIVFCATFFRRSVVEKVGFVNDLGNDLYFYLRVAKHFKLHRIDETLTNWRLHEESISLKPSKREVNIRRQRAMEDFMLVLRHGGSVFSPRALTYYAVVEPSISRAMRPILGFAYPLLRRLSHQIKFSIAVVQTDNGSYARPLLRNLVREVRSTGVAAFRHLSQWLS